jgi:hypothetical protein
MSDIRPQQTWVRCWPPGSPDALEIHNVYEVRVLAVTGSRVTAIVTSGTDQFRVGTTFTWDSQVNVVIHKYVRDNADMWDRLLEEEPFRYPPPPPPPPPKSLSQIATEEIQLEEDRRFIAAIDEYLKDHPPPPELDLWDRLQGDLY